MFYEVLSFALSVQFNNIMQLSLLEESFLYMDCVKITYPLTVIF